MVSLSSRSRSCPGRLIFNHGGWEGSAGWNTPATYYITAHYQDTESKQLYLIHRNKHREADKMRRQRNMVQMKGQIKTPEKVLNKMEISDLSDAEFKTLVIRMLKELSEDHNSIKNIQSEMKDRLIEIKNNLQGKKQYSE